MFYQVDISTTARQLEKLEELENNLRRSGLTTEYLQLTKELPNILTKRIKTTTRAEINKQIKEDLYAFDGKFSL